MLYRFLHLTLRFWLRIHFKRIFTGGLQHVPKNGPAILACNHPNSFLDAVVVALLLKRPVHFLVRSDVFKKKLARKILAKLNMIPVYRLQEGMENLEKNQGTFKICFDILSRGGLLLIFSEGICVLEKRLRPLKKGTARIAFGAEELHLFKLNVKIVPVALNYTQPAKFRSELMLYIAEPFTITDLADSWHHEPAKAIRLFNERLRPRLESGLVIIPDKETEAQAEDMLELAISGLKYPLLKVYFPVAQRLKKEQDWVEKLYTNNEKQWPGRISKFKRATTLGGITLSGSGLPPYSFAQWLGQIVFLIVGALPSTIIFLIHAIPFWFAINTTRKKVRFEKFRSSVLFGTAAILSYGWYLTIFIILLIVKPISAIIVLFFPVLLWIGMRWWETLQGRRSVIQQSLLMRKSQAIFSSWLNERNALKKMME